MKKYVSKSTNCSVKASRAIKASSNMSVDEMWDYLLDMGVSDETLQIVTDINGYSEQTMCDILYAVSGYRDFDQLDD
ncbi:MAG: hypothetical protein J6C92_14760 [Bacteroidaceae bacterium]|nr:hypothetical protein [Bacteroidaceae bacterium]